MHNQHLLIAILLVECDPTLVVLASNCKEQLESNRQQRDTNESDPDKLYPSHEKT